MAVTKRTRFEVLRRDEHTCQYCGEKAPNVTLHIDHVMPVALGGDDKPGNLVTACKDCNTGKASIAPDAPLVQGLSDQAAAYALGMVDKMTRFRADIESLEDYVYEFDQVWGAWGYDSNDGRREVPKPADYEMTLFRWKQMGIPARVYELAVPAAMAKKQVRSDDKFSYMCGIVWNMINQREIDYTITDDTAAIYTASEADEFASREYQNGIAVERNRITDYLYGRGYAPAQDFVRHVIDGTTNDFIDQYRVGGVPAWQETEPAFA